jgi:hypothetical protein
MYSGAMPEQSIQHLYHYTSIRGVEGIIKDKAVWASILHFMNDSREWGYVLDLARTEVRRQSNERPGHRWPIFISKLADSLDQFRHLNICVFSLSEMWNQLSQWRAYCPPDGGYAIRFNIEHLKKQLAAQGFSLLPCEYDPAFQGELMRSIVCSALCTIGGVPEEGSLDALVCRARDKLIQLLVDMASRLKHPDFREEYEWRAIKVVNSDDPGMSYRIQGSIATPHFVISLDRVPGEFPIEDIMVGPNPHQALAVNGLTRIVFKAGVRSVTTSQTPLRNF